MKIVSITKTSIYNGSARTTSLNTADMATIAMNNVLFNDDDKVNIYLSTICQGASSVITSASEQGGTGQGEPEVNPQFFPYATEGAQCAAVVTTLDWANNNLEADYEYIRCSTGYLVSGTLTSTETEFNNPFDTAGGQFIAGGCWGQVHQIGLQPF
jgi:hypothetical protein